MQNKIGKDKTPQIDFEKIKEILSIVPDMISVHDPQMNIHYSNWKGYANVPPENRKLYTKCYSTYRNYEHICPDCQAKRIIKTKESFQEEIKVLDGTWVDFRVIPLLNNEGEVEFFMEWVRDISDRKATEEALRHSEDRYRKYIENAPEGIFITDENGNYVDVNQEGCTMVGYSREELLSMSIKDLHVSQDNSKKFETFNFLKKFGKVDSIISLKKKDGAIIHSTLKAIKLSNNRYLGLCSDITEKIKLENQLKLNKDRLEAQLNLHKLRNSSLTTISDYCLQEAVILTQSKFGYLGFLNSDETILTIHSVNAQDNRKTHSSIKNTDFKIKNSQLWNKIIKTRNSILVNDPMENILSDILPENHFAIERHLNIPIFDDNKIIGIVGVANKAEKYDEIDLQQIKLLMQAMANLIKQKDLEMQLIQSRKMDAIGQLAGGIAHDFNNILASISGFAEILETGENLNAEQKDFVTYILQDSRRAANLTKKLLTFSKKAQVSYKPINLHALIRDTISILMRSIDKKISIKERYSAKNDAIIGDQFQIQNAILNICINSVQAMNNGGNLEIITDNILLDDNYCSQSQFKINPQEYIRIEISDTGEGIPEKLLQKIFEPFFTTKKDHGGTGLGLSVVYGIIQDHKGCLEVSSELNQGTSFHVFFPISQQNFNSQQKKPVLKQGKGTILVVDDEKSICRSTQIILQNLGYTSYFAENGEEALKLYRIYKNLIDLVILDMIMPKMDGKETFLRLREINPELKILISSGYTKPQELDFLKKHNLNGFIQKPFLKFELSQKIEEILRNS